MSAEQLKTFDGHDFFPVNEKYRVKAKFEATPNSRPFSLPTTTGTTKLYRRIGVLHFELEGKELTAMLVKFKSKMGVMTIPRTVNENTSMQAAVPAIEVNRLFTWMGVGMDTLRAIAFFIILISGISVFVSLFNSLKERKYELALMRSMGASRGRLFILVLLEGLILSLLGFVLGMLVSRIGLQLLSGMMESSYHYGLEAWSFLPQELILLVGTLGIGILAALLPALQAFNVNISKTLAQS